MNQDNQYFAVVLAADRNQNDPVAKTANVACKALAPVKGVPMIQRVLDALRASSSINDIVICGPKSRLQASITESSVFNLDYSAKWVESKQTPSSSAYHAMEVVPLTTAALVTTSDVPFLSPKTVEYFCAAARESNADLAIGFVDYKVVRQQFPSLSKTTFKCKEGAYCGCNLFAFNSPNSRVILKLWQKIEHQRKHPLKLISILGSGALLRYFFRISTLAELLESISAKVGITIAPVLIPYPEAAVDVDSAADWEFVQSIDLENN